VSRLADTTLDHPEVSVSNSTHSKRGLHPRSASIIINNHNYGQFVGQAIRSALAQTHPTQVIVVDDGSTDNSREIIASFGSDICAIFKPNGGHGSAMNEGFAVATGDIVLFLDSDDLLSADAVSTLLAEWQPDTVLAQYPLKIVDTDGATQLGIHPDPPTSLSQGDVRSELLRTGSFGMNVTSGLAFSRQALSEVMPMPAEDFRDAADGYLVRAAGFLGRVQRLKDPLGSYRRHGRNDSDVFATAGGLAQGLRKKIRWTQRELNITRYFASRHQLEVEPDLGERNPEYLGNRLFLLIVDPATHPVPADRRLDLLRRYIAARWTSMWPLRRRVLAIGLAVAVTFAPTPAAITLLRWFHNPKSRPGWLRPFGGRTRAASTS
jgi:glycosyltransferase involved in cell wall biosynthesis